MKRLLLAISFFTRIPINFKTEIQPEEFYKSMILIPVVGLLIGLILYTSTFLIVYVNYLPIEALLLVSIYLIITGGIHYDGVADSIDGLFSSRDKQEIMRIMKDPNIGTFGTLGLIMFILSFFLINCYILKYRYFKLLILYPIMGRYGAIELGALFPSARLSGLGYHFCQVDNLRILLSYSLILIFSLFFLLNYYYIVSFGILIIVNIFIGIYLKYMIKGITGDQLGLIIEFDQIIYVITFIILKSL